MCCASADSTSKHNDVENATSKPSKRSCSWGKRHTLALLGFIGSAIACSIENNLSIAIVGITDQQPIVLRNGSLSQGHHHHDGNKSLCAVKNSHKPDLALNQLTGLGLESFFESASQQLINATTFGWNEEEQGLILASFYWGFVPGMFLGVTVSNMYGGKNVFLASVLVSGVLGIILPIATTSFGKYGLMIIRIFQGMAQGTVNPALQVLLSNWTPIQERSSIVNFVYTGFPLGTAATLSAGGYIVEMLTWPFIFYITGLLSILWSWLWFIMVRDHPLEHPDLSKEEEMLFINVSEKIIRKKSINTPWRSIFSSVPVWAIYAVQVGQFWSKNITQVELPKYLSTVHGLKTQNVGITAAVPNLLNCLFGIVISLVSDKLISSRTSSPSFARKLCCGIAGIGSAAMFLGMGVATCNISMVFWFLCIGGMLSGANRGGWMVNTMDIASSLAGTVMTIGNVASYVMNIVTPYLAGILLHNYPDLGGWQAALYIAAITNFGTTLFFLIFATSEQQKWSN